MRLTFRILYCIAKIPENKFPRKKGPLEKIFMKKVPGKKISEKAWNARKIDRGKFDI